MPSLEKYHDNFYELIFSILYLVKSLRNTDIKNIAYIENVDYNDSNFEKKIFQNNEIIYVTNGIGGFKDSQKWRVVQFNDNNGVYSYDIEPYNDNGVPTKNKQQITSDRMRSIDENKTINTSIVFREKYENKFLLCVIYLCFIYCFPLLNEKIQDTLLDSYEFNKLMKTVISENMYLFNDLSFSENLKERIELIMVTIQKSILKQFNIDSDKLIGLMNYDSKKMYILLGNYKLKFTNNATTTSTILQTDLYKYYESCDIYKFPELPTNFQVTYNNNNNSNKINLFNILCNTFNINPDAMLSVVRYNLNDTLNYINKFYSNKSSKLTGLNLEEIVKEKTEIPNVFKSTMRAGKKKNSKTKSNKKYKGGLVIASTLGAGALLSGTFYIAVSEIAAFTAAGYVAVGSGLSWIGGSTVLMTAGATTATSTVAAVNTAAAVAGGIAAAPVAVAIASVAVLSGLAYLAFGESAEQTVFKMYQGKTMLEKLNVLNERKANNENLYDFEEELDKKTAESIKEAQEREYKEMEKRSNAEAEAQDENNEIKWNEQIKNPPYKTTFTPNGFTESPQYALDNPLYQSTFKENEFTESPQYALDNPSYRSTFKENEFTESPQFLLDNPSYRSTFNTDGFTESPQYALDNPLYKSTFTPNGFTESPQYALDNPLYQSTFNTDGFTESPQYALDNPLYRTTFKANGFTVNPQYSQSNVNLLDSYNNNLPLTLPNTMVPAVPMLGATIGLVALGYIGVKITKGVIRALKEKNSIEETPNKTKRNKVRKQKEKDKFDPTIDYSGWVSKNTTQMSNRDVNNTQMTGNEPNMGYNQNKKSSLYFKGGKKIRKTRRKKYNQK